MKNSTISQAIDTLSHIIKARCDEAVIEPQDQVVAGYDAYVLVKVPTNWLPSRVSEFQEWVWSQAYDIMMNDDIDIRIEVWNLTRNQQELVKWIFVHYPDVQEEHLPSSKIIYNRDAAREWYNDHDGRVDERMIQASKSATSDRHYIEHKYGLQYGT